MELVRAATKINEANVRLRLTGLKNTNCKKTERLQEGKLCMKVYVLLRAQVTTERGKNYIKLVLSFDPKR